MTWLNYGKVWEFDHVIGLKYKKDGKNPTRDELLKRLHYTNLQPMHRVFNIRKGNRYVGEYNPNYTSKSNSNSSSESAA
jgi:hypothetical protein